MTDEEALLRRAQGGDARAFEPLVAGHAPRVWRLACRMVGQSDAAEVVQQTFLAAWEALPRFRPGEPFAPWLMTIATHRCLNVLRGRKRSRTQAMDEWLLDPGSGPEAEVERRDLARRVRAAVSELPATAAAIVGLHYDEGLTCAEIGGILGMGESAVKVALFRARGKLRDILKKEL